MSKQGRGQLHIEYKNLLAGSFKPLIIHVYFIQKDKPANICQALF